LEVWSENPRAVACYRKCGFEVEGTLRQDYYQQGRYQDILVMGVLKPEFLALHGGSNTEAG
jgi:RimJ/RimL family protein N-acetyltransferase